MSFAGHPTTSRTLHLRLDVDLDGDPISGRLHAADGAGEPFVGWLGFVDALQRLRDANTPGRQSDMNSHAAPRQDAAPILVVGGTGKTGRRVAERLGARGLDVRVGSRSAPIPFDWEDRATWGPALDGVEKAYVTYYPDLAMAGAPQAIGALAAEAKARGVRHVVLLSGRGEPEAQEAESVLREAGLDWTIVRCSWFAQNFSEGFALEQILAGEVAMPAGDVPEPFVDADDIADVVVAALTQDGHAGRLYELTGPRALTFAEAIAEIAGASGREIAFVPIPLADYSAALAEHDVPEELVDLIAYLFGEVLDGRNSATADGVQQALGRPARDFSDYARETAATGAWHV